MNLQPSPHWQGPIRSDYGWHLVLVTRTTPAALPRLSDVQAQVKDDLLRDTIAGYREKAILDLTRRFTVVRNDRSAGKEDDAAPMSDAANLRAYTEAAIPGD
jgi:parvulin-like peptidyl-prolyl isomerase